MGQAKQKAAEMSTWLKSLTDEEKIICEISRALFDKLIKPRNVTGMCYHSVFFMHEYLKEKHGVDTEPVIGYVNDGTDDIMISHAWLEYAGKKTDVSLAVTEHPEISPAGQLIVLDKVIKSGHRYSYHTQMTPAGLLAMERIRASGNSAIVDHKAAEHLTMVARAKNPNLIRAYLDAEPNGFDYEKITQIVGA